MLCLLTALLVASTAAIADEPSPAAKAEIQALLDDLGSSPCEFYRNGTWYKGADAKAHLNTKYEYLLKRDKVGSTEEFIDRAATRSSMSGEAYQVRCPDQAPVPSATWLINELLQIRKKQAPAIPRDPRIGPTK